MKHQRFLDISEAVSVESFETLLIEFANELDFGIVAAALVVDQPGTKPLLYSVGNTPDAFLEASRNASDVARDPVIKRLKKLSVPFIYDQNLYVQEHAGDLWEQQAQYGYKTGISVALHLPGHRHFLLGVDRDQAMPKEDSQVVRMLADLQLAAVHAQDAAIRLLGVPFAIPAMTDRELAILRWSHAGKTASVVADILGISTATVSYHVGRILVKLECETKNHAILKAISFGLI